MSRSRKRPFMKSRKWSKSCRNGGTCSWCRGNRLCSRHRAEAAAKEQLHEWQQDPELQPSDDKTHD